MTNFYTCSLSKLDTDDIDDVLLKVEQSFGFKFSENELSDVKTFGELCDIIINKVQGSNVDDCTTQQAFYKVRDAIAATLNINKSNITPDADLQQLFPKHTRRHNISAIEKELGIHTKILRPKSWVSGILILITTASLVGLFFFWKIALPVLFTAFIATKVSVKYGIELDLKTVGELAEKLAREHYKQLRRNSQTVNRKEIEFKVKELFVHDLYIDKTALSREARFN